jgi:hypothetical protein
VPIKPEWVKGHSTAKQKSYQEDLNILADSLAGNYAAAPHHSHRPNSMPLPPPNYAVRLVHSHSTVTSKLHPIMLTALRSNHLTQHIMKKARWTE